MFNIHDLKTIIGAEVTFGIIIISKVFAAINLHMLSVATSIAGLTVAFLTSVSLLIKMRKDWRETPPKDRKLKKYFNQKK